MKWAVTAGKIGGKQNVEKDHQSLAIDFSSGVRVNRTNNDEKTSRENPNFLGMKINISRNNETKFKKWSKSKRSKEM